MDSQASASGVTTPTFRIFISSPGDVATERDRAKDVVTQLARWYGASATLVPVLWEELPLTVEMPFQEQIDVVAKNVDIAVFIVWSKIGTPVIVAGKHYQSGTEREFDLMLRTLESTGGDRPDILFYHRRDDRCFEDRLQETDDDGKLKLIEQKKLAAAFVQEHFWSEEGNVRAYHSFQRPVDFAGRLKVHLRGLIDQRLDRAGVSPQVVWTDAPYRGLEVFDLQHSVIFFGRDLEVAELEQRLRDRHRAVLEHVAAGSSRRFVAKALPPSGAEGAGTPEDEDYSGILRSPLSPTGEGPSLPSAFVAVVGASGSGKSSLVRAGLRASLIDYNLDTSVQQWRTVVLIPGQTEGQLLTGLVHAIAETDGALPELQEAGIPLPDLAESLGRAPREAVNLGFNPVFQRLSERAGGRVQLLVVIDQFEELLTDSRIGEADREAFLRALEALAQSGWCWVVATMRSDFYPLAQRSETFVRMKGETGQFDLLPPGPEALRRIITEPARLAGVTFEKRDPSLGGQSLDAKILGDAQKQPDTLPLLSDLLLELYLRRTSQNVLSFAAYEELGGMEGALTQRAEKAFQALTPEQQAVCPELLHALVTVEADSDAFAVRRRANKALLGDTLAKAALIDAFISTRLLTASGTSEGEATVSLAHEALLRKWERIARWVRENRQHLQIRSRVEQFQKRWETAGQRDDLLLAEGLELEEGLSLLRDAPRLVAGAEYVATRAYVVASEAFIKARHAAAEAERQRQEAEKESLRQKELRATQEAATNARKAARNARSGLAAALVLLGGALLATWFAWEMQKMATAEADRAETGKVKAQVLTGKGLLYRADQATKEGKDIESLFLLARAVGFEKLGKPVTAVTFPQNKPTPLREDVVGLELRNVWNRFFPEKAKFSADEGEFPVLLSMRHSPAEYNEVFRRISRTSATPFLWSSPIAAQNSGKVSCVAFSPDGRTLASGSENSAVRLWDVESGVQKASLRFPSSCVVFSPDGQTLATASGNTVKLWDVPGGKEKASFGGLWESVNSVAFSPDGLTLAVGFSALESRQSASEMTSSGLELWDLATREEKARFEVQPDDVNCLVFSPDGQTLASASVDTIKLWDVATQKEKASLEGHLGWVRGVAFSPNGLTFASCSNDNTVKLWDVAGKKETASLEGHSDEVTSVAFSHDGQTLASASADDTVKLWDISEKKVKASFQGHSDGMTSVAFGRDGQTLAGGSGDNALIIWDLATGKERVSHFDGHSDVVTMVAFNPDGQILASSSADGTIRLWDLSSGEEKASLQGHSGAVNAISFSPGGLTLASCSDDKTVKLWDVASKKEKATFSGHSCEVSSVTFSPDGVTFGSNSVDGTIKLWDLPSGIETASFEGAANEAARLAFSPDGQTLAIGSGYSVKIWDVAGRKEKATFEGHSAEVICVAFSPHGNLLASGSADGMIKLWETSTGKEEVYELRVTSASLNGVTSLSFTPNGEFLASSFEDGTIKVWERSTGKEKGSFEGHLGEVTCVTFSPDGMTLASSSGDNTVKLWKMPAGEEEGRIYPHSDKVICVAFSPDGQILATGSQDNTVRLWDMISGKERYTVAGHTDVVTSVTFSPNGQVLASGSEDLTVKLWDVSSGKEKATLSGHSSGVIGVAFSPDGQALSSSSKDCTIKLWEVSSGKELATVDGQAGGITSVTFSPDGQTFATGSEDGAVLLWGAASGRLQRAFHGHSGKVSCVGFSPDGRTLASGSSDKKVRLWNVRSGEQKATLRGHLSGVTSVAFSPDGQILASGSEDGTTRLWNVSKGEETATFTEVLGGVTSVAFSPDGLTIASSYRNKFVELWGAITRPLNLHVFLEEGWCEFHPESGELVWNEPKGHLYRSIHTPLRNVPPNSFIAILHRFRTGRISEKERNWALYLAALEAENWPSAEILYRCLPEGDKERTHQTVERASTVLARQTGRAIAAQLPELAGLWIRTGKLLTSGLEPALQKAFYTEIGDSLALENVTMKPTGEILAKLPDEARETLEDSAEFLGAAERKPYILTSPLRVSRKARDHIIFFETWGGGKEAYENNYERPNWPGYSSGVTVGLGYDLGYHSVAEIRRDWEGVASPTEISAMLRVHGVTGSSAQYRAAQIRQHVHIDWEEAQKVFDRVTLPEWSKKTSRAYRLGLDELHPDCNGALVGNTFNRGEGITSSEGRQREKYLIREAIRRENYEVIPGLLREQRKYWPGEGGFAPQLRARRSAEADLFQRGLNAMKAMGSWPPPLFEKEDAALRVPGQRSYERNDIVGAYHPIWTSGELHPNVVARKDRVLGIGREGQHCHSIRAGVLYAVSAAAEKAEQLGYHAYVTSGNRWGVSTSPNHSQDGNVGDAVDVVIRTRANGEGDALPPDPKGMQDTYDILAAAVAAGANAIGWGRANVAGHHVEVDDVQRGSPGVEDVWPFSDETSEAFLQFERDFAEQKIQQNPAYAEFHEFVYRGVDPKSILHEEVTPSKRVELPEREMDGDGSLTPPPTSTPRPAPTPAPVPAPSQTPTPPLLGIPPDE